MHPASQVRESYARCIQHLSLLQAAAWCADDALPPHLADDVGEVTAAIVAETEAAAVTVSASAGSRRSPTSGFLAARLARMAAAANDAVDAAKNSDAALLQRHLRHFEALTSAMWTVQLAILAQGAPSPRMPARGLVALAASPRPGRMRAIRAS